MLRRSSSLFVLALGVIVASCNDVSGLGSGGTPIGIVLMNARTQGAGYTTYPKVNFYSVGTATFSLASQVSDTCVVAPYDTVSVPVTAAQIGGGPFLIMSLSGNTDSLYKAASGDQTYHPATLSGVPFNPGDSITFQIAGDAAGFPQLFDASSRTAEPFTIIRPVLPPSGQNMIVSWTAATDPNAAMYLSLLYNSGGGTTLNTQVFCDFHDSDNGAGIAQGTVQAYLIPALESSSVPFVVHAQRLRTALILGSNVTAYLNIISTFEVPTPVSP
jgi:hypothetical protein